MHILVGADLRAARENILKITRQGLAGYFRVAIRTVENWERPRRYVPDRVAREVERLCDERLRSEQSVRGER